jgi:hypothetical protein
MPLSQCVIFSLRPLTFESGPYENKKAAAQHLDRLFANTGPNDLREFVIVGLGSIPAKGVTRGNR